VNGNLKFATVFDIFNYPHVYDIKFGSGAVGAASHDVSGSSFTFARELTTLDGNYSFITLPHLNS
jgi:hypothetical protein